MNKGNRQRYGLRQAVALACACALVLSSPLVFQGAAARAAAGGSTLSLNPSIGTYGVGQTIQVSILLDTNGEAVNAVQADLSFPADKLEVTGLDYRTGCFLMLVLDHSFDNATGHIRLAGGVPSPGFTGPAGRVATITFRTKSAGIASVVFDATCAALRNSDSVNVLTGTQPGQFTISAGGTMPGGLVVSPPVLSCSEGGTTGLSVSLGSVPTANVTVAMVADSQLTVSPAVLTFAPAGWNTPQSFLVSAVDDKLTQGTRTVSVRFAVTSADPAYQALTIAPVPVTIFDNDLAPAGHLIAASVSGTGGVISPEGSVAVPDGASLRFVMTPADGYEIDTLTIDGVPVVVLDRSSMAYDFGKVMADHTISCTFRVAKDTTAPTLTLVGLAAEGTPRVVTSTLPWKLPIRCTDDRGAVTVRVSEGSKVLAETTADGDATISMSLTDGTHAPVVSAVDAAGNTTSRQIELIIDTAGPAVTFSSLPESTSVSPFVLNGRVTDAVSGVASLTVGGSAVEVSSNGDFSYRATLSRGSNTLRLEALDKLGNASVRTVSISYAPVKTVLLRIGDPTMTVNGETVAIDSTGKVAPIIQNSRTLLPIRALIEALGGTVDWDSVARKATIGLNGTTLELWIGKSTATVNGHMVPIDAGDKRVMPVIVQGRTLLPVRFVAESLGLDVSWDGVQRIVTVTADG